MPADYEAVRDNCIERKKKKKGSVSEQDIKQCKKMAAIFFYKKHGKTVKEAHAELAKAEGIEYDTIDTEMMIEQLDFFGSLQEHEQWGNWNETIKEK